MAIPVIRSTPAVNVPLVRLDINANQQWFDFLDPIIATVRLHNATEVRLSLGPDATVPTQVGTAARRVVRRKRSS